MGLHFVTAQTLILDEADALLDQSGFSHQVGFIVEQLEQELPPSATAVSVSAGGARQAQSPTTDATDLGGEAGASKAPGEARRESRPATASPRNDRRTVLVSATFDTETKLLAARQYLRADYKLCENRALPPELQQFLRVYKPTEFCSELIRLLERGVEGASSFPGLEGGSARSPSKAGEEDAPPSPPQRTLVVFPTVRFLQFFYVLLKHYWKKLPLSLHALHARLTEDKRRGVLALFAGDEEVDGRRRALFATDLASRGVDFCKVDLVVQIGASFLGSEQYVHRSGRTARGGRRGTAVLLLNPFEKSWVMRELELKKEVCGTVSELEYWDPPRRGSQKSAAAVGRKRSRGGRGGVLPSSPWRVEHTALYGWWEFNHFYASSDLMYKSLLGFYARQRGDLKLSSENIQEIAFGILKSATGFSSVELDAQEKAREYLAQEKAAQRQAQRRAEEEERMRAVAAELEEDRDSLLGTGTQEPQPAGQDSCPVGCGSWVSPRPVDLLEVVSDSTTRRAQDETPVFAAGRVERAEDPSTKTSKEISMSSSRAPSCDLSPPGEGNRVFPGKLFPPYLSRDFAKRLRLLQDEVSDVRINTNAQRIEVIASLPSYPGYVSREGERRAKERLQNKN